MVTTVSINPNHTAFSIVPLLDKRAAAMMETQRPVQPDQSITIKLRTEKRQLQLVLTLIILVERAAVLMVTLRQMAYIQGRKQRVANEKNKKIVKSKLARCISVSH